MADAPVLSKADRLAIGGAVAPVVRTARARPVVLVGKDGKPVGVTSSVEVAKSLLRRSEIEFSTQGRRPQIVNCASCGIALVVPKRGRIRRRCLRDCARSIQLRADPEVLAMIEKERVRLGSEASRAMAVVSLIRRGAAR